MPLLIPITHATTFTNPDTSKRCIGRVWRDESIGTPEFVSATQQ
ncbi:hypothetical protein GW13_PRO0178 [Salmonella enterica subsp. enterica serovar Cerro]|uniref:Uncharacterized protein n=1 Tax=Salmonella enterica subsp. enterica serovar Senftenberg str. A4-543 TaxID=913082 RepID=G5R340_SALSE|nr:hypothetical protein GW13_PRO0178 [Salmonella enterica subsp. enterica serovar Cerro]EHC85162.1 hypothetical protein LTSESEN_3873 [Salmonella enterica subsp. enterica serovar Senftenberg str. A4-543]